MTHVETLLFGAQLATGAAAAAPGSAWNRLRSPLDVSEIKAGQLILTNRPYSRSADPKLHPSRPGGNGSGRSLLSGS